MNESHRKRRQAGAVLVELALVTPFMAVLIAGLLHFGMTMRAQEIITNASRVGARRGTQAGGTAGAMQTAARDYAQAAGLDVNLVSISSTAGAATTDSTCTVTYQFTSPVQAFIDNLLTKPIAGGAGGAGWWTAQPATRRTLTAATVMKY